MRISISPSVASFSKSSFETYFGRHWMPECVVVGRLLRTWRDVSAAATAESIANRVMANRIRVASAGSRPILTKFHGLFLLLTVSTFCKSPDVMSSGLQECFTIWTSEALGRWAAKLVVFGSR